MPRIKPVTEESAPEGTADIFAKVRRTFGGVPNIFLAMGNSPAVLQGYLDLKSALDKTTLAPELREKIALAVGQINNCRYCLAAHSAMAQRIGMSEQDIVNARVGDDADFKTQVILRFVRQSVQNRGWLTDDEVLELRAAGVNEQELVEIVMAISLNLFTNYFCHIANPEVDYPVVNDL